MERLAVHIGGALDTPARFVSIDAAAVDSFDPGLLDLLGVTQHRLSGRRAGLLQVRGLHPSLLPSSEAVTPVVEPGTEPTMRPRQSIAVSA